MPDYDLPAPSPRARALRDQMARFMRERVLPAEAEYLAYRAQAGPDSHVVPPVVEKLKEQARAEYIRAEMQKLGLADIRMDDKLNVSGVRKGTGGGPTAVFARHQIAPCARRCSHDTLTTKRGNTFEPLGPC